MTEKCKIYHNSTNFCVFVLFPFLIYSGIYSDPLSGVYITAYSLYVMENFPKYALTHNYSSAYTNNCHVLESWALRIGCYSHLYSPYYIVSLLT